ncbi:MAG: hypothetical protein E6J12_11820 [Chloroflexi bacterium]|nr:MAG: hypothetical protein E6J12_11820 [Chloroflexota bacterium]
MPDTGALPSRRIKPRARPGDLQAGRVANGGGAQAHGGQQLLSAGDHRRSSGPGRSGLRLQVPARLPRRSFAARFTRLGGNVVGHLDVDPSGSQDVASFLKRVRADGAQAVYFGGITANGGCVIRSQMTNAFPSGDAAPYLGGDGIAEDPACVEQAGSNSAGMYATVPAVDPNFRGSATPVIKAFRTSFPSPSDYGAYTVVSYDATGVLYAALDRAIKAAGGRLPERADVIAQLAATQGYSGATGTIGFDAAGDTTHRALSVYEAAAADPKAAWTLVGEIDYTEKLPY